MYATDYYLALVSLWVIVGNSWHALLLFGHLGTDRPLTISEHAVVNPRLLLWHRIVHSAPLVLFMPLIFGYLLPNTYYLAALALLSAAIFDSLETLTLNKQTAPLGNGINAHNLTAWVMAMSYMAYSVLISRIAGLSLWIYGSILVACVLLVLLAASSIYRKRSLHMEMAYFVLVSLVGVLAHIKLILQ